MSEKAERWAKGFYLFLCAIPIVVFFGIVWKYALNIPFWDDYDAVLLFLTKFLDATTITQKIHLIFAQHNEHRIAFNKLVTLGQLYLNGTVDFRRLILIGNIGLMGITGTLWAAMETNRKKLLFFAPVSFLLLQPQYWENIHWAMASLQNFYVIFFAFLSLFLISKKGRWFLMGIIFAALATFTQGNGMLVFPIGVGMLLYQKQYMRLLVWATATLLCARIYFNGYIQPAQHPHLIEAVYNPVITLRYFFSFIGASLGFGKSFSFFIGIGALLYFLYLTAKKYFKKNIAIYGFFGFLFLSAAAVSFARSGFGVEQALASRYAIVSILFYILIYLSLIETHKSLQKYIVLFIFAALFFNIFAYSLNFPSIKDHRNALVRSIEQWWQDGQGLLFPDGEGANQRMQKAIEKGVYTPLSEFSG